jgi:Fe-S-cluster containining protein
MLDGLLEERADERASPADDLDCLTCGACCFGDDGWVHVDGADDARVDGSEALARLVVLTRHGAYVKRSLRMVDGACAALKREKTGVSCSVYRDRPTVCRDLERGSSACHAARKARGLEGRGD